MWEQVKRAIVHSAREARGSVSMGVKNLKNMCWNDGVKSPVERKEAAWKEVLGHKGVAAKERCMEAYKERVP